MIRNESELARTERHGDALDAVAAGIDAAHPEQVIERAVGVDGSTLTVAGETYDLGAFDRVIVLGGGNAGGRTATALERALDGVIDGGMIVTDDPSETDRIEMAEGTHPLPSEQNVAGTERLLDLARETTADDLVLVSISGGGSALMCAPRSELSVEEYRDLTEQLLHSGATIDEINAVRKHLSTIKGGQLARALAPSTVIGLVFSDVVGNRLDVIASGPTTPDGSTYADALAVRDRYDLSLPEAVDALLERGRDGEIPETPRAGDEAFDRVTNYVLADGKTALEAAGRTLDERGYEPVILSTRIEGEASEVGTVHVGIATECAQTGEPFEPPVALLSGGETTVTVEDDGRGGPNQEFGLSSALGIGDETIVAAVDTDGIDGNTDAAGAIVDGETAPDADRNRAESALDGNDAYAYLDERDRLIETGPTGTNVNDLRILLVGSP